MPFTKVGAAKDVFENTNYIENRGGSPIRDDFSVHYGRNGFYSKNKATNEMVSDISARVTASPPHNVHKSLSDFLEKPFHANLSLSHNIGYHHLPSWKSQQSSRLHSL
ncbi:hypothetical protein O9992_09890 [Vibrio lentus]|nr:hypothetical protein [Vibrio lentus]